MNKIISVACISGLTILGFFAPLNTIAEGTALDTSSETSTQSDYVTAGDRLLEQKDYKGAIAEYDKALKSNKNALGAHSGRAIALGLLGDFAGAEESYNKAILLDNKNSQLFYGRGAVLVRMHKSREAIQNFDEALKLEPNMAVALYSRAGEYCNLLQFPEAIADYNSTLKCDPNYIDALRDRGLTFFQMGEYEKARENLDRYCLLTAESDPMLIMYRGFASLMLGKMSFATNQFQSYIEKSKDTGKNTIIAAFCAALASKADGDDARAEKILEAATKQAPIKEWPFPLVQYFRKQVSADDVIAAAKDNKSNSTEAHFYVGLALSTSGMSGAPQQFRWVVDNGDKAILEYGMARDEITKLHQATMDRALFKAIQTHDTKRAEQLLNNGANIQSNGDDGGDNTLVSATIHENHELVKLFLDRGVSANSKLNDGRTALYFAAMDAANSDSLKGTQIIQLLIEKGADVDACDEFGITPLMNAARTSNLAAVKLLIDRHANVNLAVKSEKIDPAGGQTVAKEGDTALSMAKDELKHTSNQKRSQAIEIIKLLEQAGAK